jgi:hypothetical protein
LNIVLPTNFDNITVNIFKNHSNVTKQLVTYKVITPTYAHRTNFLGATLLRRLYSPMLTAAMMALSAAVKAFKDVRHHIVGPLGC